MITAELARDLIDENTIGVVGILGSTYNGEFEDINALNDMVGKWLGFRVHYRGIGCFVPGRVRDCWEWASWGALIVGSLRISTP